MQDTVNWTIPVHPAGGYYDQLTRWIRKTYPDLRIIGNAGGRLYTNQREYASLVDVICSFEESLASAMGNRETGVEDWGNLTRDPLMNAPGQLVLIHTDSTRLEEAIDQAIGKAYSHFFTTQRDLDHNIWGALPSCFASEVEYVSKLP